MLCSRALTAPDGSDAETTHCCCLCTTRECAPTKWLSSRWAICGYTRHRTNHSRSLQLRGKGNKVRLCPLWASTTAALKKLVSGRADKERVFLGRSSQSMTRFGVHDIVTRYARIARGHRATLRHKRVGPHKIRHTTATHLPRAGVDINTIRAWPRHVSIDITNIYAESVEMKAKALGMCEARLPRERRRWRDNPDLLTFLAQL